VANFRQIISFIQAKEGGLTGHPSDSASSDPAPCGYDPKYDAPYHTNKGITWTTFKSNADKLGYTPSCSNFLNMPNEIWEAIYKNGYWDKLNADAIDNQGIANAYVTWAFGSGVGGARSLMRKMLREQYGYSNAQVDSTNKITAILNKLSRQNAKALFNNMVETRRNFFIQISPPGSNNQTFLQGWLNRLEDFRVKNAGFVTGATWVLPLLIMGVGAFFYLKANKKL